MHRCPPAERRPILGRIEHSQRHPEVTRCGGELVLFDLSVERSLTTQKHYAHTCVDGPNGGATPPAGASGSADVAKLMPP
jgi:hypothetical protein